MSTVVTVWEYAVRMVFISDDYLSDFAVHALPRSQVKRHAGPTPVIDVCLQGDEGFSITALTLTAFFLHITDYRLAINPAGRVLTTDSLVSHSVSSDRAQGPQNFDFLCSDFVGLQRVGRLHRHHTQQLQQMVLNHIPQLADVIVVTPPPFNTDGFCCCNLDVVNATVVPLRVDHTIRKPQCQQVLHGLFTQVMINTVDVAFVKTIGHSAIDVL